MGVHLFAANSILVHSTKATTHKQYPLTSQNARQNHMPHISSEAYAANFMQKQ
jgi:hypothetical protein